MIVGLSVASMVAANLVAKAYMNAHQIKQAHYTIQTPKIQQPYRILFISDLHYGAWGKNTPECPASLPLLNNVLSDGLSGVKFDKLYDTMFEAFNSVNADVILLGGDMISKHATFNQMRTFVTDISKIHNTCGIYYTEGDVEYEPVNFPYQSYVEFMNGVGIHTLIDDSAWAAKDLNICGRRSIHCDRKEAYRIISRGNDWYTVVVDHTPLDYYRTISENTDLMLSGKSNTEKYLPKYGAYHVKDGCVKTGVNDNGYNLIILPGTGPGSYMLNSTQREYVVIDLVPIEEKFDGEDLHDTDC